MRQRADHDGRRKGALPACGRVVLTGIDRHPRAALCPRGRCGFALSPLASKVRQKLLGLVWAIGVHLLQEHCSVLHVEPDASVALGRRLVLPAVVSLPVPRDPCEIAAERVVRRSFKSRRAGKEVPGVSERAANRRREVPPSLLGTS